VIELQHSPIAFDERHSRENFYERMVWVVNGMRYKRDIAAFREAVAEGVLQLNPLYLLPPIRVAGIFQRWARLQCDVFIDFGDEEFRIAGFRVPKRVLWQLMLYRGIGPVVIAPITRESFIQFCLNDSALRQLAVKSPQQPRRRYPR
jgi:competence protein CoiA